MQPAPADGHESSRASILGRDSVVASILGTLGMMWFALGLWVPSIWADEGATMSAVRRSWSDLWRLLHNIDAVHGLYYAGLKVWFSWVDTNPVSLRLPSLLAMGGVVAGTYLLARRFANQPTAVLAAVVCAALPRSTWMAIEGRSWAFGTLAAVIATLLLIDWVSTRRRHLIILYGVTVAIGIGMNIYLVFLVVGHAASLLLIRAPWRDWWRWGCAAGLAVAAAAPVVLAASGQRSQLGDRDPLTVQAWLASVFARQFVIGDTPGDAPTLVPRWAWSGAAVALAVGCWGLVFWWGWMQSRVRGRSGHSAAVWLVPWIVIPPVAVLVVGVLGPNLYHPRYFGFATPAFAIAVAAGLSGLTVASVRRLIALGLLILTLPVFLSQREVYSKNGYDWSVVADFTERHTIAGDGVYFADDPPARVMASAFPHQFAGRLDLTVVESPAAEGSLDGTSAPLTSALLENAPARVVAIWSVRATTPEQDRLTFATAGYREVASWRGPQTIVALLER